jgi:uncharacterized protein (TIGR03083 family)
MTEADTWIAVARQSHDHLADIVRRFDDAGLARVSGSREWDVAQVLGHLGSGAEINKVTLEAALGRRQPPGEDFTPQVWARWNALGRREKADEFLRHDEALVQLFEGLDDDTRASLRIDIRFLPQPIDVATAVSLRLSEMTYHSWDVKVVDDSKATLYAPAVDLLMDRFGTLIQFVGHADELDDPVTLAVDTIDPVRSFGIEIADRVSVIDRPAAPDVTLTLPAEAWLRLVAGRLRPDYTPADVTIDGKHVGLDDLRRVFPGF